MNLGRHSVVITFPFLIKKIILLYYKHGRIFLSLSHFRSIRVIPNKPLTQQAHLRYIF